MLSPNMDSSSFARHHTWQAELSQMGAKTDMTLFLASTMRFSCNITILGKCGALWGKRELCGVFVLHRQSPSSQSDII